MLIKSSSHLKLSYRIHGVTGGSLNKHGTKLKPLDPNKAPSSSVDYTNGNINNPLLNPLLTTHHAPVDMNKNNRGGVGVYATNTMHSTAASSYTNTNGPSNTSSTGTATISNPNGNRIRTETSSSISVKSGSTHHSNSAYSAGFRSALSRLNTVMIICTICFLLQVYIFIYMFMIVICMYTCIYR